MTDVIFITGDTHGDFCRFTKRCFPEQAEMTREDYVIICGDFGGVWDAGKKEREDLDLLESRSFTTLFVSGNHENYDLLERYPKELWNGGLVQKIRPHVIHLCRGQVFTLRGSTFFTMGGASSHDVDDGILDPCAPDYRKRLKQLKKRDGLFRVKHCSWWEQELPSEEEYAEARANLEKADWKVDYILTHCAPDTVQSMVSQDFAQDHLTHFLEEVREKTQFRYWFFGHYHDNRPIDGKYILLYEQIVEIPEAGASEGA